MKAELDPFIEYFEEFIIDTHNNVLSMGEDYDYWLNHWLTEAYKIFFKNNQSELNYDQFKRSALLIIKLHEINKEMDAIQKI